MTQLKKLAAVQRELAAGEGKMRAIELISGGPGDDVDFFDLDDDCAAAVAKFVAESKSVTKIDLSGNRITGGGAKSLADALKTNRSVETLHLTRNSISDAGMLLLIEVAKTHPTLRVLSIDDQTVPHKEDTRKALLALQKQNLWLDVPLGWHGEAFKQTAAKQLKEVHELRFKEGLRLLKENKTPVIRLTNLGFESHGLAQVYEAIKDNTVCVELDLTGNVCLGQTNRDVQAILRANRQRAKDAAAAAAAASASAAAAGAAGEAKSGAEENKGDSKCSSGSEEKKS